VNNNLANQNSRYLKGRKDPAMTYRTNQNILRNVATYPRLPVFFIFNHFNCLDYSNLENCGSCTAEQCKTARDITVGEIVSSYLITDVHGTDHDNICPGEMHYLRRDLDLWKMA
jgi:hypothetical protein